MENEVESNARCELAVAILPIIFQAEAVSPDLAAPGWNLLLMLISSRLGEDRFEKLIYEYMRERKTERLTPGYVKLLEELKHGHKGS